MMGGGSRLAWLEESPGVGFIITKVMQKGWVTNGIGKRLGVTGFGVHGGLLRMAIRTFLGKSALGGPAGGAHQAG